MKYVSETRSKTITFNNISGQNNMFYNINLNKGNTYNLGTLYGFSSIIFKEYLFISEDDSIATVNEKGIITAIGNGSTNIKVYNKSTLDY